MSPDNLRASINVELEPFWDEHKEIALSQVVPPPHPDISSLLSTYDKLDEYKSGTTVSETDFATIHVTILEILYKSKRGSTGIKDFLVFFDTREETELLGKLFKYDDEKLGRKKFDDLYYPHIFKAHLEGSFYSNFHVILAEETRNTPVICGTTDIMRDGANSPFDVVLQIERHNRTEIAYTFIRPGIDDHATSEFMKIEQQQGDVPM
ncbi:hypothetical protein BELL_0585g00020 [Botrytis elliptica]|uniref:Uncharacterized protein n=1 Tax=Botrytis elliptica TaxID=278938 RepID=A0A4Z1JPX2_9HELO|nr:hypothetical protein EAE99_000002 [Botrytis elliptica]TGO71373.1 hypothetical protein BELL_0585g00020 [Botrytis elliptica]